MLSFGWHFAVGDGVQITEAFIELKNAYKTLVCLCEPFFLVDYLLMSSCKLYGSAVDITQFEDKALLPSTLDVSHLLV